MKLIQFKKKEAKIETSNPFYSWGFIQIAWLIYFWLEHKNKE